MKIFLICPVRGISDKEKTTIEKYVADLEKAGHKVHWPLRDTDQNDPCGLRILGDNIRALILNKGTDIWWNQESTGSKFDLGVTFALKVLFEMLEKGELTSRELIKLLKGRSIVVANPREVRKAVKEENKKGVKKSFNKVLLELHKNQRRGKRDGNSK